jgi:hypothetical protein
MILCTKLNRWVLYYLSNNYIELWRIEVNVLTFSGYSRGQSSSVSPRGYTSNGSTPHSNGSSYGSSAMNGYHGPTGGLGNMGR